MRFFRAIALSFLVVLSWSTGSAAAPDHDHGAQFGDRPPNVPPVTYIIRAAVLPDSLIIRGEIDIDYRNDSFDTLQVVRFALALNDPSLPHDTTGAPYCRLDSILYRGTPLKGEQLRTDGRLFTARPPGGIAPGGAAAFFLSFKTRLSPDFLYDDGDGLDLSGWYPEICARVDNVWYLSDRLRPDSSIREFADYNLELEVDSSWSTVFPGELINDKIHFGLVPDIDDTTVQEDVLSNFSRIPGGERYRPVFANGLKNYYVKARSETGFPLLLHSNLIYDRALADSVAVTVAYSRRQRKRWHGTIAADAARFVRTYTDRLGPLGRDRVTVAPAPLDNAGESITSLILLPNHTRSRPLLRQMLAVRLAQLWFPRPVPGLDPDGWVLEEGLGCFAAMSLAAPDDSKTLYYYLDDYYKWREKVEGYESASNEIAVRTIPGWLQICGALSSDSIVWTALCDYVDQFRYAHPSADTLLGLLRARATPVYLPTVAQGAWLLDSLDIVVSEASFKQTDQGYSVVCEIIQNGPIALPIEVGFVDDHGDTLYTAVTVEAHSNDREATVVNFLSERRLSAVVADPNHCLPDFNRTNNYYLAHRSRFRYEWPKSLFPAYDN